MVVAFLQPSVRRLVFTPNFNSVVLLFVVVVVAVLLFCSCIPIFRQADLERQNKLLRFAFLCVQLRSANYQITE